MVQELVLYAPMLLGCVVCVFDIVLTAVQRHVRRPLPNSCVFASCALMLVYTLAAVAGNAIFNCSDYHTGTWDDFVGGAIVAVAIAAQNAATFLQLGMLLEQCRRSNPPKQGRPSLVTLFTVCRVLQFASIPVGVLVSLAYFLQSAVAAIAGGDVPASRAVNSIVMIFAPRVIDALFKLVVLVLCVVGIRERRQHARMLALAGVLVAVGIVDSAGWAVLSIWDFVMAVAQVDDAGAHNVALLFFASILSVAFTIVTGVVFFPKGIHAFREPATDKVKIHGKTVTELQSAAELNEGWEDDLVAAHEDDASASVDNKLAHM